LKFYKRTR